MRKIVSCPGPNRKQGWRQLNSETSVKFPDKREQATLNVSFMGFTLK